MDKRQDQVYVCVLLRRGCDAGMTQQMVRVENPHRSESDPCLMLLAYYNRSRPDEDSAEAAAYR